jgi:hypothetical protein
MVFNLFPGIGDTPFTGSHDLVECGQICRIGVQKAAAASAATCWRGRGLKGLPGAMSLLPPEVMRQ